MKIGTDGSVKTPDPDVIVTLDDEDIRLVRWLLGQAWLHGIGRSDISPEQVKTTAAKFQRIWESEDEADA